MATNDKQAKNSIECKDFLPVPYHLKNFNCVKRIAKSRSKRLAPERSTTVFNALRNEKDPLEETERRGVYKIPIWQPDRQINSAYVGVTSRNLSKRIEEHKIDIKKARTSTSLAQEAYASNIEVNWKEARIIRNVPRHTQPVISESLEILRRKEKENLVNDRIAWEPSGAWKYAINKHMS